MRIMICQNAFKSFISLTFFLRFWVIRRNKKKISSYQIQKIKLHLSMSSKFEKHNYVFFPQKIEIIWTNISRNCNLPVYKVQNFLCNSEVWTKPLSQFNAIFFLFTKKFNFSPNKNTIFYPVESNCPVVSTNASSWKWSFFTWTVKVFNCHAKQTRKNNS